MNYLTVSKSPSPLIECGRRLVRGDAHALFHPHTLSRKDNVNPAARFNFRVKHFVYRPLRSQRTAARFISTLFSWFIIKSAAVRKRLITAAGATSSRPHAALPLHFRAYRTRTEQNCLCHRSVGRHRVCRWTASAQAPTPRLVVGCDNGVLCRSISLRTCLTARCILEQPSSHSCLLLVQRDDAPVFCKQVRHSIGNAQ